MNLPNPRIKILVNIVPADDKGNQFNISLSFLDNLTAYTITIQPEHVDALVNALNEAKAETTRRKFNVVQSVPDSLINGKEKAR